MVGCRQQQVQRPPLNVVATIAPLADWARQVGREHVVVTQIVPAGVDPRHYKLSEGDRQALIDAEVLLYNGLGLEPWLDEAVPDAHARDLVVLELAQFVGKTAGRNVQLPYAETDGAGQAPETNGKTSLSPYLWLDPGSGMAQLAVQLIADTFTRVDVDRLLIFRRNAERYNGELENFDNWVKREIRSWPRVRAGSRDVLMMQTTDYRWQYFAQHYNITLRVLTAGPSSDARPINTAALFVDQFANTAEYHQILGTRQPDGILKPLAYDNYLQLMRENVLVIGQGMRRVEREEGMRAKRMYDAQ